MSTDHELAWVIRAWLRGRTSSPPRSGLTRALDVVAVTPQRHAQRLRGEHPRRAARPGAPAAGRSRALFSTERVAAVIATVVLGTGALFYTTGPGLLPVASPSSSPTASPSPSTWTPPSSLVTEELSPGVLRATDDGAGHRLRYQGPAPYTDFDFGPDGSIWIMDGLRLIRAGHQESLGLEGDGPPGSDLTAAPDGSVWALAQGTVVAHRDGGWVIGPDWPGSRHPTALEVSPDGTVWASDGRDLGRLDGGAWTTVPVLVDPAQRVRFGPGDLAATADGMVWINLCAPGIETQLLRFDGSAFHDDAPVVEGSECSGSLEAGPDGALWAVVKRNHPLGPVLARRDPGGWTVYPDGAGVPGLGEADESGSAASIVATADGRLWGTAGNDRGEVAGFFDGSAWTDAFEIATTPRGAELWGRPRKVAPDGRFWILTVDGFLIVDSPVATVGP